MKLLSAIFLSMVASNICAGGGAGNDNMNMLKELSHSSPTKLIRWILVLEPQSDLDAGAVLMEAGALVAEPIGDSAMWVVEATPEQVIAAGKVLRISNIHLDSPSATNLPDR